MVLPDSVRPLPADDLSWFADLVGDARVVAIGENNHHIREFSLLRAQLLRFLVTELDFRVVAFESGFAEGQLVDDWIRGGPGDVTAVARDGFTFRFGEAPEVVDMLVWLREHNASGGRVRFAVLDVPGSGGSGEPALRRVREHLAARAPEQLPLVDAALEAIQPYAAANNGLAANRYAELAEADRNAATAALSRLLLRLDALPAGSDRGAHRIARHHALGALRVDEQLREFNALAEPDRPELVVSSRDVYQAETVRLLRELLGPEERVVLMLHNGHAQRVPIQLLPGVRARSAGCYLAAELGSDYVALGVTACTGVTTAARLDEQAHWGLEVLREPLGPPSAGSVERIVADHVPGAPALLDLRSARPGAEPVTIRHATTEVPVDLPAAFDAVVCLPEMNPSSVARRTNG